MLCAHGTGARVLIVTGTIRSGTSMWMQILAAAGFAYIGEKFPRNWGELLDAANQDGFFESELIAGIYYRTNPHPVSGAFLFPEQTRSHAVKVFIPGLIRTDLAFIDRVVATMREWRQYTRSVARLHAISSGSRDTPSDAVPATQLPAWLNWWSDNFALIRDLATRQYPVHVTSYDRLLGDPEREIREVLGWLGAGDPQAACDVVNPERRTQGAEAPTPEGVDPAHAAVFDELYDHVDHARPLSAAFIAKLNETDQALRKQILEYQARAKIEAARSLFAEGGHA
jgi:hypothetical protein